MPMNDNTYESERSTPTPLTDHSYQDRVALYRAVLAKSNLRWTGSIETRLVDIEALEAYLFALDDIVSRYDAMRVRLNADREFLPVPSRSIGGGVRIPPTPVKDLNQGIVDRFHGQLIHNNPLTGIKVYRVRQILNPSRVRAAGFQWNRILKVYGSGSQRTPDEQYAYWARENTILTSITKSKPTHIVRRIESGDCFSNTSRENWILMEDLPGGALANRVNRFRNSSPPTLNDLRNIFLGIIDGLIELHQHGYAHGDLKPENIGLTKPNDLSEQSAKLLDLGSACSYLDSDDSIRDTFGGSVVYTAPELLNYWIQNLGVTPRGAESSDDQPANGTSNPIDLRRCDLYSLGAVLYYALTAREPRVYGAREPSVQDQITFDIESVSFPSDLPPGLVSLIKRLMAKDPSSRPDPTDLEEIRVQVARLMEATKTDATPLGRIALSKDNTNTIGRGKTCVNSTPTLPGNFPEHAATIIWQEETQSWHVRRHPEYNQPIGWNVETDPSLSGEYGSFRRLRVDDWFEINGIQFTIATDGLTWRPIPRHSSREPYQLVGRNLRIEISGPGQCAMESVDFAARTGEVTWIVGPSGSGKSILLKAMTSDPDYQVTRGQFVLDDGRQTKTFTRDDYVYVSQSISYYSGRTIGGAIEDEITIRGAAREAVEWAFKETGFPSRLLPPEYQQITDNSSTPANQGNRQVSSLSGGEQTRFGLGLALMHSNKKVFLFDEVDSPLDAGMTADVAESLRKLACDHIVIAVTHKPDVFKPQDRVVLVATLPREGDPEPSKPQAKVLTAIEAVAGMVSCSFVEYV